ncbi:GGDEF domain-containing protein [Rhizobium sp. TH2]|uniref:GGDEF domain-containing protein n=1 Tax=Rhizobium sp. TH2 TaxID=2775403 RepID=UPI0021587359|nr:GGDEF domain-containing protein [Rhizobium sp. TH2]UVC09708.1 GGDEF domain-containing protein [Rhizobium sp. TH2]
MAVSTGVSVLIAASIVPILGGTYDGIGMWMSFACPMLISFPASAWQFHQSEKLRNSRDELAALHLHADRMHRELLLAHTALTEKARMDAMTGGLNREAFFAEFDRAAANGRAGTLLLADADHFKQINDTFGHQTGDEALMAIASAIGSTTGISDFWGRIGGEEFAIFLDGSDDEEASAVAEAIRRNIEAIEIKRERGRVPVSISIGGVHLSGHFSARQAMSDADRQLYRAKRGGRNRVELGEFAEDDVSAA